MRLARRDGCERMGDGGRGEEEKERWKRKGGSEEEGRTVGTFEWLVSG